MLSAVDWNVEQSKRLMTRIRSGIVKLWDQTSLQISMPFSNFNEFASFGEIFELWRRFRISARFSNFGEIFELWRRLRISARFSNINATFKFHRNFRRLPPFSNFKPTRPPYSGASSTGDHFAKRHA